MNSKINCCDKKYILNGIEYKCSLNLAMDIIGGKWKILILWHLNRNVLRFADLQRALTGISKKVLTESLRDLEKFELITRKVYPEVPPKVEYSISELGKDLFPVLEKLAQWGEKMSQN